MIVTICALAFGVALQVIGNSFYHSSVAGVHDFVVYWATGQQLIHHGNPYDPQALLILERQAGFPVKEGVLFMRNPPWALPITYPLGLFHDRIASMLWSTSLIACLIVSVYLLWRMHGRPRGYRAFLAYSFAPALICIINQQTAVFALLGITLFLVLYRRWPFFAGCCLYLCFLKPHLFLPFGVVLILWVFVSRSYRILLGAITTIGASIALVHVLDPAAWQQYSVMVHTSGMENDFIPCLSFLLRRWLPPQFIWVQYVPAMIGCVWAIVYFWPRRHSWDWRTDGSLLMLVSVMVAPYSWLFDQCLVIPALLQGVYITRSRTMVLTLAFLSALIEISLIGQIWQKSAVYLWTLWSAPAWLIWYLLAVRPARAESPAPSSESILPEAG